MINKEIFEKQHNVSIMDNNIFFDDRLNLYEKILLVSFNALAIDRQIIYSIKKLSEITNMSESTIKRSIPNLIKYGYIEKTQDVLANGFKQNCYKLNY